MIFIGKEGLAMKKMTLTALFLLVGILTACGTVKETQNTDVVASDVVVETDVITENTTPNPPLEELPEEEENEFNNCKDGEIVASHCFNKMTRVKTVAKEEANKRYFIGRDNYEENIGYFNNHLTEDTEKLYIKKKM